MVESGKYAGSLNLKEGWLCLDFANTAEWHASDHPQEQLNSYPDLVAWSEQVGLLTNSEAQRLLRKAKRHPGDAAAVLRRAIALRDAIYRILSRVAHGHAPQATDLTSLNAALPEALARSRIVPLADRFAWGWTDVETALDRMLWPVARSAADLLTSADVHRVGECADERGCGWLFLDMSRNHSRRWCDMKDCGNRAKARRHYKRKLALQTTKER